MRPKRRVLVYCADGDLLAQVGTVLRTDARYAVATAGTRQDAVRVMGNQTALDCMVLLCHAYDLDAAKLMSEAARRWPEVRLLLVVKTGPVMSAHAHVIRYGFDIAEIRETLWVLCGRKRGPKKAREEGLHVKRTIPAHCGIAAD